MLLGLGMLRALVEMLGLCLMGQLLLGLIAGSRRHENPIYAVFALITRPPCQVIGRLMRRPVESAWVKAVCFLLLLIIWLGIAFFRLKA